MLLLYLLKKDFLTENGGPEFTVFLDGEFPSLIFVSLLLKC